jgi:hypothetical protein
MSHRIFLVLTLAPIFFLVNTGYCQSGKSSNEDSALQHAREVYSASLSEQAGIYHGYDYIGYPHPVKKGQPFFLSAELRKGEIRYDGMLYKDVPMWYDIAKNEVVVQHLDNYSRITLHNERISDFSIGDHQFIKIAGDTAGKYDIDEGFYDQIYKGRSEILVKRAKDFLISTDTEGVWISFSGEKSGIFLRTGDKYQSISSQKSVLSALGNHQKEILAHLKQNKVKFGREREKAIKMMVAYYDQLNSQI